VRTLAAQHGGSGVRGLEVPSDEEIRAFVDPTLYRSKADALGVELLNQSQRILHDWFENGEALALRETLSISPESQATLVEGETWIAARNKVAVPKKIEASRLDSLESTDASERNDPNRKELELVKWELNDQRKVFEGRLNEQGSLLKRREGQIAELREALARAQAKETSLAEGLAIAKERLEQGELWQEQLKKHAARLFSHLGSLRQRDEVIQDLRERLRGMRAHNHEFRVQLAALTRIVINIEASFERLGRSRSFHFMAYTLRRLGLVSRTPRACVEAIKRCLVEVRKALGKLDATCNAQADLANDKAAQGPPRPHSGKPGDSAPVKDAAVESEATGKGSPRSAGSAFPLSPKADVIICVHNAIDEIRRCLSSIVAHSTSSLHQIILIDDGSNEETNRYLRKFVTESPVRTILLENPEATGYTRAANRGLAASTSAYAILLNSDTLVPAGWIERLIACGESNPALGIVGPLSNAASWQSVPERYSDAGDWAVNELAELTFDQIACAFAASNIPQYPRVSLVNGFCLAIKREVIATIGLLDQDSFPQGYGEENDYCLRAGKAGFALAIADNCYVFHSKSKSYSHERRRMLAKQSATILRERYGAELDEATAALKTSAALAEARLAFARLLEAPPVSILFLMQFRGFGGGITSIVQEADGLRKLGAAVQVAIRAEDLDYYHKRFPTISPHMFLPVEKPTDLISRAAPFEMVVATLFTGVKILCEIIARSPNVAPCYYIQDYEPFFFASNDPYYQEAVESYTLIPTIHAYAKTRWLCDLVNEKHGIAVHKVEPSIDREIFFADDRLRPLSPRVVCAMVRPHTARRSPELTFSVLRRIKLEFKEEVKIRIFGLTKENAFLSEQPNDFEYEVLGILDRKGVAELLRESYLFIDASTYQAFGRTGLEAMACGCATILPTVGGPSEYAIDGVNTLLAAPGKADEVLNKASRYLQDRQLHCRIVETGLETASRYSVEAACASELQFFESIRHQNPSGSSGCEQVPQPTASLA
jgi:O-antigen biosynthesis protein